MKTYFCTDTSRTTGYICIRIADKSWETQTSALADKVVAFKKIFAFVSSMTSSVSRQTYGLTPRRSIGTSTSTVLLERPTMF